MRSATCIFEKEAPMSIPKFPASAFLHAAPDGATGSAAGAGAASPENPAGAGQASGNGEGAGKPNETKAEKFKRLAKKRVENAGEALVTLAKCFEPAGYDYTEEQIDKIFGALKQQIATMETAARDSLKPASDKKIGLQIEL
jgi:hypothetical protein